MATDFQSKTVFGDNCYIIGHIFTISVTMDVSPFAWCLATAEPKTHMLLESMVYLIQM